MAVQHIQFNDQLPHGRMLRRALDQLEEAIAKLEDLISTVTLMIDGDGSQASHFTYVTSKFGFADNATAKAAWDELNSLMFKLTTNSSITDMYAALNQAFNKFR